MSNAEINMPHVQQINNMMDGIYTFLVDLVNIYVSGDVINFFYY